MRRVASFVLADYLQVTLVKVIDALPYALIAQIANQEAATLFTVLEGILVGSPSSIPAVFGPREFLIEPTDFRVTAIPAVHDGMVTFEIARPLVDPVDVAGIRVNVAGSGPQPLNQFILQVLPRIHYLKDIWYAN